MNTDNNSNNTDLFEKFLSEKENEWQNEHHNQFEQSFDKLKNWNSLAKKMEATQQKMSAQPQNEWVKPAIQNQSGKVISIQKFWSMAASLAAMLLFVLGYHFHVVGTFDKQDNNQMAYQQQNGSHESTTSNTMQVQNVSLPAELIEAEGYYAAIIAKETKELQEKDTANWVTSETVQTLEELDNAYQVMKDELIEEQNPRLIIGEMLENLRLRRQILEESIQLLEESQNSHPEPQKNQINEKSI